MVLSLLWRLRRLLFSFILKLLFMFLSVGWFLLILSLSLVFFLIYYFLIRLFLFLLMRFWFLIFLGIGLLLIMLLVSFSFYLISSIFVIGWLKRVWGVKKMWFFLNMLLVRLEVSMRRLGIGLWGLESLVSMVRRERLWVMRLCCRLIRLLVLLRKRLESSFKVVILG